MPAKDKKIALTITASTRQLRQDMRRAGREVKGFERHVMGLGNRLRQMRMRFQQSGIFGRGGGALRTAAGFAGVFGIQQMFQGAKEENAALTDIAITGNLTDKQLQKLRKTMYEVSNNTAKSTSELTRFVATVTTMTGDAKGASEALAGIGETMVATGASGEALAGTYVKLTTTMGLMPKQAREAFNILRSQEKLGSITMANIASNFGKIVGAAGVYGAEGKGLKGVRTLGGLYQIAQRGFGVGQETEAATSVAGFLGFMARRSKQIKKTFGVEVFGKGGQARDLPTVLEELGQAFLADPEKFRTKGQLIFGRAGIRTAQQLAEAARAPGGFSGKIGAFASANALLRTAGGEDVIGADAARRRKSASYQFDEQINILKNAMKKHMVPLFKQLASTMKEFGPDLVRFTKFLLENSRGLLTLWLGYKGVTFFRNLMAPVEGGAMGAAAGVPGMAQGAGVGGGGWVMGPGGRLIPSAAGGGIGAYGRGYGFAGAAGGTGRGRWVNAGRSGGRYYQAGGFGFAGMGMPMVAAGGAWGSRSGRNIGSRWGGRLRNWGGRAGAWGRGMYGRYGASGWRGAGMGMGAAAAMDVGGGIFSGPSAAGDMAGNMALMSGNPYLMAAGGFQKASNAIGNISGSVMGNAPETAAWGLIEKRRAPGPQKWDLLDNVAKSAGKLADMFDRMSKETPRALKEYYRGTWRGFEEAKRQDALLAKWGFGDTISRGRGHIDETTGEWVQDVTAGAYDMTAKQKVSMAQKLGRKGLETLHGRVGMEKARARAAIIQAMRKSKFKGEITEEMVEAQPGGERYSKLKDFEAVINKLILVFQRGLRVNIDTVSGPGKRVDYNSQTQPHGEGLWQEYA